MKRLLLLLMLSIVIAAGLFFVNSSVIESTTVDKVSEIGVLTIPVFIVVCLFYYINRALIRKAKTLGKRKPSDSGKV